MNNDRRKRIDDLATCLIAIREELEDIRNEEADAYENLPESIRDGERGEQAQEAVDTMEEAISELEDTEAKLTGVTES